MRAVVLAVAGVAILAASTASSAGTTEQVQRCAKWTVSARIGGQAQCLREQQGCKPIRARQYQRHGFDCQQGTLRVRWAYLRQRPLVSRRLSAGATCPLTTETRQVDSYVGLGRGPAFPLGSHALVTVELPPRAEYGPEWGAVKRVWLVDARYPGRILVRGAQLDGDNEVRFVDGRPGFTPQKRLDPVREFQLEGGGGAPSLTRLRAPGCYAYQVDGRTFSYLVVFEARLEAG